MRQRLMRTAVNCSTVATSSPNELVNLTLKVAKRCENWAGRYYFQYNLKGFNQILTQS